MDLKQIEQQAALAAAEVLEQAKLQMGDICVIGCSTSEVGGEKIGSASSMDIAGAIFRGIQPVLRARGIFLAAQCCEHLNRAIVIEREAAEQYGYAPVNVLPQPKAGGSFATTCWQNFMEPVAVEHIRAHAGIDIGGTLIGMHLREVAVPLRISQKTIGEAIVLCARTRLKFIGGARAHYQEDKL
ncbi:MAG: TIGR01440 family protein [Eubacteriales bacterium]|nr:TIGR01440 family protein [Eubacteriales bacterium]